MAALSPKSSEDISWVSPKRRQRPPPMAAMFCEVGRDGGAVKEMGTFGKAERFGRKNRTGHGVHSPDGNAFYVRNQLFKRESEVGKEFTQGIGERSKVMALGSSPPAVGPGSYEIVASAAQQKSPLDGPDYCTFTMKAKLGSSLVPKNMCSPGPHAKYEVRKDLDSNCPQYSEQHPKLKRGGRHRFSEDTDGPGPGHYSQHNKTIAHSVSVPNMRAAYEAELEKKFGSGRRVVVGGRPAPRIGTTFGSPESESKPPKNLTHSPNNEMYYVHSKILMKDDYLQGARSCGMGLGAKTDFANPSKLSTSQRTQVCAVTYFSDTSFPISSMTKKTSPLDGFASRCTSPVFAGTRGLGAVKRSPKPQDNAVDSPSKSTLSRVMSEPAMDSAAEGADAAGVVGAEPPPANQP